MMQTLVGYRTYFMALLLLLAPLAARWGFKFDPVTVADAMTIIAPAVMAVMRSITRTPPMEKEL